MRRAIRSMHCSVVIPCFNGADLTRACIASLLAQEGDDVPFEILLVDNGSTDATSTLGVMSPRVQVLRQERNLGFAGGVNAGLRAARGELVLVLNNDTQAATNMLRELREALLGHPRMGAVAPVSNHVKGDALLPVSDRGRDAAGRAAIRDALAQAPALQDATTLAGLCLMLRRRTVEEVGLFDERFGHGNFEDDDFCLRLRLHGLRLGIAGRAFLHHEGHATFKSMGLDLKQEIHKRRAQFRDKWRHDPAGRAHIAALDDDAPAAAAAARDAAAAWPLWPDADWHLAAAALLRGDHAEGIARLRGFLRQCPLHADARILLAQAHGLRGDVAASDRELVRALDCAPSRPQQARILRRLGERSYRDGRYDDARAQFGALAELNVEQADVHNWIGLCELGAGRVDKATEWFARAATTGLAVAATNLGVCRAKQGRMAEARACFARAVELDPNDATARANLAACDQFAGR